MATRSAEARGVGPGASHSLPSNRSIGAAVMLLLNALFLLYTATIVPVQIFLWDYSELCIMFPTLYFDLAVDTFFLVMSPSRILKCIHAHIYLK